MSFYFKWLLRGSWVMALGILFLLTPPLVFSEDSYYSSGRFTGAENAVPYYSDGFVNANLPFGQSNVPTRFSRVEKSFYQNGSLNGPVASPTRPLGQVTINAPFLEGPFGPVY